jgi:hypothetical protein
MSHFIQQVGAPDPELRTSPILEELDEGLETFATELLETSVCFFNDERYHDGALVCSGHELLRCERGSWVRTGSCDPDNP